jgi:RHS repeat-associated protein
VSTVDAVGNQSVTQYDPAGNVIRTSQFGPTGGPSPTSDGPAVLPMPVSSLGVIQSGNLVNSNLLSATESFYDEVSRTFQTSRVLFVNTIPTVRTPDVAEGGSDVGLGNLTPGQTQAIPGVSGVTILGRVSDRTEYDRDSRTTFGVQDDLNTSRTFYDGASRVIETLDPQGNTVETAYDANSNVIETRQTDVAQVSGVANEIFLTTSFYDSLNRLQQQTENLGQTMYDRYDSRGNRVAMADAQGPLNGHTITRRAFPDGPRTVDSINDFGNVTRYFYDGLSRKVREEQTLTITGAGDGMHIGGSIFGVKDDPSASESRTPAPGPIQGGGDGLIRTGWEWDQNSLLSSMIDDQGNVTVYLYDDLNRKVTETKGLVAWNILLTGTSTGSNTATTLNDTSQTWTVNQWAGKFVAIISGTGVTQVRMIVSNTATQLTITPAWDTIPDATSHYRILEPLTLSNTKILGARVVPTPTAATINNPGTIPTAEIDTQLAEAAARIHAVENLFPPLADSVGDHPPTTIVWGYSPNDLVLIMQDENNSEVFTKYDAINRPIAVRIFRTGQSDSFAGDMIFAPSPVNPIPTDHSHDDENAPPVVRTTIQNFQYDGLSRRTLATDNNDPTTASDDSTVTDAYDSLSRVIEETQQIGALPTKAIDSAWRAESLRKSLTYPNGRIEVYTYNHLDRLASVADQGAPQDIADYKYIGVDRVLERAYPINGTRETYLNDAGTTDIGYDGVRRPVEERNLRADNSLIVGFTYAYDRMDNKLTEGKLHDAKNGETYTYDSAYRLISFHRAAGGIVPIQSNWTLDGVGNWKQVDGETRQHSSFNEIISRTGSTNATIISDDNGNETDDGTFLYTWDAMNRLRTVTRKSDNMVIAVYSYDADGRRIRKVVTNSGTLNGTTDFYLDGQQEIEEHNAADNPTQQYVYGSYLDEPLVLDGNLTDTPRRLFYHQNALYSVFALTDATGQIVEGYQYDAYGRQTVFEPGPNGKVDFGGDDVITRGGLTAIGNPFFFTGRRLDSETGLYYFRARYDDPVLGRFLSRDPATESEEAGNSYLFLSDNPESGLDPLGRFNLAKFLANKQSGVFQLNIPVGANMELVVRLEIKDKGEGGCKFVSFAIGGKVAFKGPLLRLLRRVPVIGRSIARYTRIIPDISLTVRGGGEFYSCGHCTEGCSYIVEAALAAGNRWKQQGWIFRVSGTAKGKLDICRGTISLSLSGSIQLGWQLGSRRWVIGNYRMKQGFGPLGVYLGPFDSLRWAKPCPGAPNKHGPRRFPMGGFVEV